MNERIKVMIKDQCFKQYEEIMKENSEKEVLDFIVEKYEEDFLNKDLIDDYVKEVVKDFCVLYLDHYCICPEKSDFSTLEEAFLAISTYEDIARGNHQNLNKTIDEHNYEVHFLEAWEIPLVIQVVPFADGYEQFSFSNNLEFRDSFWVLVDKVFNEAENFIDSCFDIISVDDEKKAAKVWDKMGGYPNSVDFSIVNYPITIFKKQEKKS